MQISYTYDSERITRPFYQGIPVWEYGMRRTHSIVREHILLYVSMNHSAILLGNTCVGVWNGSMVWEYGMIESVLLVSVPYDCMCGSMVWEYGVRLWNDRMCSLIECVLSQQNVFSWCPYLMTVCVGVWCASMVCDYGMIECVLLQNAFSHNRMCSLGVGAWCASME